MPRGYFGIGLHRPKTPANVGQRVAGRILLRRGGYDANHHVIKFSGISNNVGGEQAGLAAYVRSRVVVLPAWVYFLNGVHERGHQSHSAYIPVPAPRASSAFFLLKIYVGIFRDSVQFTPRLHASVHVSLACAHRVAGESRVRARLIFRVC